MPTPSSSLTIRPLQQSDRARWEKMFADYATFYKTEIPGGAFDHVWQWVFDPKQEFYCDIAIIDDEKIIGFTQYQLIYRSLGGNKVCYLNDLFVDPNIRGTGAGRAMIDNVIEFARKNDIAGVQWITQEFNYAARKLYDTYEPKSDFIMYRVSV